VYSKHPGAVAAPTAGLHFTENVFRKLAAAGIEKAYLTLHVGYGTFKPIQADRLSDHQVDQEEYIFPEETAQKLNDTRHCGHKVVAVGTTCTRVLESCYSDGKYSGGNGSTDLYIFPPYTFRAVDVLQTNFHLPRSSLLALVCAFAGRELLMDAYHLAIKEQFRFYSYGDVMLIR
jgi:S-adenosylmethionine:tRNA ribosyltransferase-isomerase